MLQDLDRTIEKLIITEGKLNRDEIEVSFDQPTGDWSSRLSRPTINCWCFDLRENMKYRSMERQVSKDNHTGQVRFPPRRYDVTYLVTAWARKTEDEHQLLWRALGALRRVPILSPERGEGTVRYHTKDIPLLVATFPEGNPINFIDLWSVLGNEMRLGFSVTATVELDLEFGFDAPLILEAFVRVGQSDAPADRKLSALDVELILKADKPEDENSKEGGT